MAVQGYSLTSCRLAVAARSVEEAAADSSLVAVRSLAELYLLSLSPKPCVEVVGLASPPSSLLSGMIKLPDRDAGFFLDRLISPLVVDAGSVGSQLMRSPVKSFKYATRSGRDRDETGVHPGGRSYTVLTAFLWTAAAAAAAAAGALRGEMLSTWTVRAAAGAAAGAGTGAADCRSVDLRKPIQWKHGEHRPGDRSVNSDCSPETEADIPAALLSG